MTKLELNAIATRAIIDERFTAGILNGHRNDFLKDFTLPEDIHKDVMAIKAQNLMQFIQQINEIAKRPSLQF
jgi:hypothetical protein